MKLLHSNNYNKNITNKTQDVKLCLSTIVKNESKIIERMLDSVISFIDFICITDTGSTDNTVKLVKRWCTSKKIPYAIYHSDFVDFAETRTVGIRNAMRHFKAAHYLLLADADFIFESTDIPFRKNFLTHDKYLISQYNQHMEYDNIRVIKTTHPWEYFTPTHEYVAVPDNYKHTITSGKLKSIKIKDIEDGGCKHDKYQRDIRLLENYINKINNGEIVKNDTIYNRCLFYLGQSYRDSKDWPNAIKYYKMRAAIKKTWVEEVFFCYYQIGFSHEMLFWQYNDLQNIKNMQANNQLISEEHQKILDQYDKGQSLEELKKLSSYHIEQLQVYYVRGYEYRRTRIETLIKLIEFYLRIGQYSEALKFLQLIKNHKYPSEDVLFVESKYYNYVNKLYFIECVVKLNKKELFEEASQYAENMLKQNIDEITNTKLKKLITELI